jgi:predicted Zn-dependent protease
MEANMKLKRLYAFLTVVGLLFVAIGQYGCNTEAIGTAVGGQAGGLIKATGHLGNAVTLGEKNEPSLGQSFAVRLTSDDGIYADRSLETYVTLVGMTVAGNSANPTGNYVFGILDTDVINAYSGPDGYVFVTRGLLKNVHDEAELAGVLGHEIAHVCHHDGLNLIKTAEAEKAGSQAVQAMTKEEENSAIFDLGFDVLTKSPYSKSQEFDADKDGVKFMSDAGYDPNSFLNFLQRLKALQAAGGGTIMATHPGIADRITRVSNEIHGMKQSGHQTLPERFASNVTFSN